MKMTTTPMWRKNVQQKRGKAFYTRGLKRQRTELREIIPVTPRGWVNPSRAEFKSIDTDIETNMASTGTLVLLNGCSKGDDIANRTGRKINVKSIYLQGWVRPNTTTPTTDFGRIMIIVDRSVNGSAPAVTDVLESADETAFRNLSNRNRFRIIHDEFVVAGDDDVAPFYSPMRWYKKITIPTTFNDGDAGTAADIVSNGVFLLHICKNTTNPMSIKLEVRVRFTDF